MLVIDGIAGNIENLLLEFDEFIFELDLVHRTIVGLFCVLFHAAKLRHEDAKEWQWYRDQIFLCVSYSRLSFLITEYMNSLTAHTSQADVYAFFQQSNRQGIFLLQDTFYTS